MDRLIRILYIVPRLRLAGTEKQVSLLAKNLDRNRFDVKVCTLTELGPFADDIKKEGIEVFTTDIKSVYNPLIFWRLYRIIRKGRFDIVSTFLWEANVIGVISAKLARVSVIISSHRNIGTWKKTRHVLLEKLANCLSNKIVAVSEAVRSYSIARDRMNPDKIVTIHSGIDYKRFDKFNFNISKLRQNFALGINSSIIGTIGTLASHKNHKDFLFAAKEVKREYNEAVFLIVGEGYLKNELEQLARDLGIENDVEFVGEREDIPQILSIMDIFVLPSALEGFSNVILEAMATGLPVVATNVGGIPELVVNKQTGILVPPDEPEELAKAIVDLLRDKNTSREMGKRGRERIEKYFGLEKMLGEYDALYQDLIREKVEFCRT